MKSKMAFFLKWLRSRDMPWKQAKKPRCKITLGLPRPTAVSRRTFSANLEHYGITVTLVTGLAQDSEVSRGFGKEAWGLRWAAKLPLLHSTHSQIARVVSLETITQNGAAPQRRYRMCARTNLAVLQNSWREGPLFLLTLPVIGDFP